MKNKFWLSSLSIVLLLGISLYVCRSLSINKDNPYSYYCNVMSDSDAAKDMLFQILRMCDAIKQMHEYGSEFDNRLQNLNGRVLFPVLRHNEIRDILQSRMNRMCDMQLVFDDIAMELKKLGSTCSDADLGKLISMCQTESDYCRKWAQADHNFFSALLDEESSELIQIFKKL